MTNPTSTLAVVANTSSATFQAWVQEIYNSITGCGLYQIPAAMDTGQMAVPCATALPGSINTSAGYYMFAFNDPLSAGPLATTTIGGVATTTGSGYTNGAQSGMTVTGTISGANTARASGTVSSGAFGNLTITTPGTGYLIGEPLTVSDVTGTGATWYASALSSAATPAILKLEFGTGSALGNPAGWVTMGTSWTSNGTLGAANNGAVTTRVAFITGGAPVSTTTPYISRYCYNTTYGTLSIVFKIAGSTTVNASLGSLFLFRTSSNSGAASSNAMVLMAGVSASTSGNGIGTGHGMQCMSYTNNVVYPALSGAGSVAWVGAPTNTAQQTSCFNLASTLENGNVTIFPAYTIDPVFRFSAVFGMVLPGDVPLHTEFTSSIIGSTTLTFLNIGLGANSVSPGGTNTSGLQIAILWM